MSTIEHLDARVGLLYADFDRGLAAASKGLDEFEALAKSKLSGIEVPAPKLGRAGFGAARDELQSTADSAASSFAPLAGTIRLALGQAVAPLGQFAARFAAQFDKVGATVQALAIRIDASMRFPAFIRRVEGLRDAIAKMTGGATADFHRLRQEVDRSVGREADASKLVGSFVAAREQVKKAVAPIPADFSYAVEAAGHVDARAGFATFLAGLDEVRSEAVDKMRQMADAVANATGKGSRVGRRKARDQAADLAATHAAAPPVQNFTAATAKFRPPPPATFWPPAVEKMIADATAKAGGFAKAMNLDVANGVNAVRKAVQPAKDAVFLLGKAATGTIDTFLNFKKLGSVLSSFGSVADATWKKLKVPLPKLSFDPRQSTILKGIGGAADGAASSLKNMGVQAAMALGIFGLVFKAVSFLKDGIVHAANLNETLSKTDAVLGSASAGVKRFAEDLGVQFGLVQQDTLDVAAGFGGLFKGLGGQSGAALEKSTEDFTKLAADLSSFANMSLAEAGQSLRTALSGNESDKLKQLGVVTDEATVKAYAYSHGIAKVGAELTNQQKLAARAGVIMQGLADAQGDLDRTAGSTANQFRGLMGRVTNLGSAIGTALLPAVDGVLSLFNKLGSWAITAFDAAKSSVGAFVDKITVGFDYIEAAINNPRAAFEVFRLTAIQALANVGEYAETLGPNIAIVAEYISDNWTKLLADAFNWTIGAIRNLFSNFEKIGKAIIDFLADPTQGFKVDWTPLSDGFKATADEFPELVKPALTDMSREIAAAAQPIADAVQAKADRAKAAAEAAAKRAAAVAGLQEKGEKAGASEIEKFAKKLSESTKTPLEEYREQVAKIGQAFSQKLITEETGKRGLAEAEQKLHGDGPKFAGALQAGSTDARSAILQALTGRSQNAVADNTRTIANQGAASIGLLASIKSALERTATPTLATI